MVQIVTEIDGPVFEVIEGLRAESVVTITGKVEPRAKDAINPNLPTGEVEIRAVEASVLSAAAELPLPVAGEQEYPEDRSEERRVGKACVSRWRARWSPKQ